MALKPDKQLKCVHMPFCCFHLLWEHLQGTAAELAGLPGLLAVLHTLEGSAGGERVAPLAETLLDEISEAGRPQVAEMVADLRRATRRKKSELAAKNRAAMLATLGLAQVLCSLSALSRTAMRCRVS